MDLPSCKACGQSVLDDVEDCPFCGASMKTGRPGNKAAAPAAGATKSAAAPAATAGAAAAGKSAAAKTAEKSSAGAGDEFESESAAGKAALRALPKPPHESAPRSETF